MILAQAKFLKLVHEIKIVPALKTFNDTILFYYLGYLSSKNSDGVISEIGVGGSTFALTELSEILQKSFYVFDCDASRINTYCDTTYWPNADLQIFVCDSKKLDALSNVPDFSYCHIDGSKNFDIALSDLEFYLNHLSFNGLICQDDYGNNKWPTITDAVKKLEYSGKCKTIMVGDSSIWITKPEYYNYWINMLDSNKDEELLILKDLCNIIDSKKLCQPTRYFFLQSLLNNKCFLDDSKKDYIGYLLNLSENHNYLKMPYITQSKFGFTVLCNKENGYRITKIYNSIKGQDWPNDPPTTRDEIASLPTWVKDELRNIHNIDIFQKDNI